MQFTQVILAALFASVAQSATVTETDLSTTLETITSCGPEVTNCPAAHSSASNITNHTPAVSTFEAGAAGINGQFAAAGVAALVAGALLGL